MATFLDFMDIVALTLVMAFVGAWWDCYHRFPEPRLLRQMTIADAPLVALRRVSSCPGISVEVGGNKFLYRYHSGYQGDETMVKLYIVFRKARIFNRNKQVLTAVFRDEVVQEWALADCLSHDTPNYEEMFVLRDILRIVESATAVYRNG